MDLGVVNGKANLMKKATFIMKETRRSLINVNNAISIQKDFKAYEDKAEKYEAGNDNKKILGVETIKGDFFSTQRNISRKETNCSHKNFISFSNNLNSNTFNYTGKLRFQTSIESKSMSNNINGNTNDNLDDNNYKNNNSVKGNKLILDKNNNVDNFINENVQNDVINDFSSISSRPNTNYFSNKNKKSLNITNSAFTNFNLTNNNFYMNKHNNQLSLSTKTNYNNFLSKNKINNGFIQHQQYKEDNEEVKNISLNKAQKDNDVRVLISPCTNLAYNYFQKRKKTEDEIALKYNKDLQTLKKYETLRENFFRNNNSIKNDSSTDEDLTEFIHNIRGSNINKLKNTPIKENINNNFNKTSSGLNTLKSINEIDETKKKSTNLNKLSPNNNIIVRESKASLNNFGCESSISIGHKQNTIEKDERSKINFSMDFLKNKKQLNCENIIIIESNEDEYPSHRNLKNNNIINKINNQNEQQEGIKSSKVKIDIRFEKKLKSEKNLPSSFISRCETRQGKIENLIKAESDSIENFEENKIKKHKKRDFINKDPLAKQNEHFYKNDIACNDNNQNQLNKNKNNNLNLILNNELNHITASNSNKRPGTNNFNSIKSIISAKNSKKIQNSNQEDNKNYYAVNDEYNLNSINGNQRKSDRQNIITNLKSKSNIKNKTSLIIDTADLNPFHPINHNINNNQNTNNYFFNLSNKQRWDNLSENHANPKTHRSSVTSNILLNSISKIELKTNKITKSISKNIQKYKSIQEISATKKEEPQEQKYLKISKKPRAAKLKMLMISSSVDEKRKNFSNLSKNTQSLLKIADFIEGMNEKVVLEFKSDIEKQNKKSALKNGLLNLNEIMGKKYENILKGNDVLENLTVKTRKLENSIFNTRSKFEQKYFTEEQKKNFQKKGNSKVKKNDVG
jgi:hypothetical protein